MRQVPTYLIIGNGQMATHVSYYFNFLKLPYQQWYRAKNSIQQLQSCLSHATHILILINDDAIEPFITEHLSDQTTTKLIHFSAALKTTSAYSAHPLFSFSDATAYTLETYQSIPFIISDCSPEFSQLLPGLTNPHYRIEASMRQYYHTMCVLSNNFTVLLWEKFFREMTQRFAIAKKDLMPFLSKTFENIAQYPKLKLTGPLARDDQQTLKNNLKSLDQDGFYPIFKSFMSAYQENTDD